MTILLLQFFVWVLLAASMAGVVVLLGMSLVLTWLFVRLLTAKWEGAKRLKEDPWAHMADPWNGFEEQLIASGRRTSGRATDVLGPDVASHLAAAIQSALEGTRGAAIAFETSPQVTRIEIAHRQALGRGPSEHGGINIVP